MALTKLILNLVTISAFLGYGNGDELLDSLNGVQKFMTGSDKFDLVFYNQLVSCLNSVDDKLLESVNAQWKGFKEYAASKGSPEDPWPQCKGLRWAEENCTVQEYGNIPIWEPCNYASNIAYYHTTTEICARKDWSMPPESVNAIAKAFASLGVGSSFMHGSHTNVGASCDVRVNDLFGYVVYQEGFKSLSPTFNPVLVDLSVTPRTATAAESVDALMKAYIEVPTADWGYVLDNADFPELRTSMCAFFSGTFTLLFSEEFVDKFVAILLNLFSDMDDIKDFCVGKYLPEFRNATAHMRPLPQDEHTKLLGNTIGTLVKLIYAFVWQEEALVSSGFLLKPSVNSVGAKLLPFVNQIATAFTSFKHSSSMFQLGQNFYPGETWCDQKNPHSKWHLETGIALPDMTFLADEHHRIFKKFPMKP